MNTPFTYDAIADRYAESVDQRPWNAHYERPAMMALLPEVAGLRILDVGCGSGWYARTLADLGADVVAIDITARMVELTRLRLEGRGTALQADVGAPLTFAADGAFDLIVAPLVLHYLHDWGPIFRELHRVLMPEGLLLFSTHHPSYDAERIVSGGYFRLDLIEETWDIGPVRFYHRPLGEITEPLAAAGFVIERLVEPSPSRELQRLDPVRYEKLTDFPAFLIVRARRSR